MSETVTLRDGPTVPLEALQLAWSLEDRGCTFALDLEGDVRIMPEHMLTDGDHEAIDRWRLHLVALVAYRAPDMPDVVTTDAAAPVTDISSLMAKWKQPKKPK